MLELRPALHAFVRSICVVCLHVNIKRVLPREGLFAHRAHKALVSRVLREVCKQVALLFEGLVADVALKYIVMDLVHVLLQLLLRRKSRPTLLAGKRTHPGQRALVVL